MGFVVVEYAPVLVVVRVASGVLTLVAAPLTVVYGKPVTLSGVLTEGGTPAAGLPVSLSMQQFPLGLIPGGCYESQRVSFSSRDLFLMVTDGISEVPNAQDEEFGLERLQQLLAQHSAEPLPEIWERVMERVRQYGLQQDDQTLLLLRVLH